MSKKEISVIISARNAMAAGLASAGRALHSFGKSAVAIGSFFAKGFLAAGAAVATFAAKAIASFAESEAATNAMEAALRAYGEEIPKATANVKAFAAAIQDQTGIDDDALVARAAQLKMLGVATDQLEGATKATIALENAGLGEEGAIKAVAQAMSGNFEMLGRYLPALKNATSESEKAAVVNDFLTRGYAAQTDKLGTVAGQWAMLKTRIGNVWEEVGAAIAQNGLLTGAMAKAGDAVKAFGDKIAEWVTKGGVQEALTISRYFFEELRSGFMRVSGYVNVAGAAIADGFQTAWNAVQKIWGKGSLGVVSTRTEEALAGMEQAEREHVARMAELTKRQARDAKKATEPKAPPAASTVAADKIDIAKTKFDVEAYDKLREKELKLIDDLAEAEKKAAADVLSKKIEALEKEQAKREELAGKNIADVLADQKKQEDEGEQFIDELDRAKELSKRAGQRGRKLSKKDAEWLDAFNKIQEARGGVPAGQGEIDQAKAQLVALQDNTLKLGEIKTELEKTTKAITDIIARP